MSSRPLEPQSSTRPVSPARTAAFDILLGVGREGAYASELLHSTRYSSLSPVDHRLTTEIVIGVLRWQSRLDEEISKVSAQKIEKLDLEVLASLRMAAYQLLYLDRIPPRAAIHESVELVKRARKKSAAPFVNAVLRKFSQRDRAPEPNGNDPKSLSRRFSHPRWLIDRWVAQFGTEVISRICAYDQQPPPTAIRLRDPAAEQELRDAGVVLAPGTLLASARIVQSGDITHTAPFKRGRVAIQDEASQLVAGLVGRGARILDCCCAPGGKTSILADQNPGAQIFAVELHSHRARLARKLVPQKNVQIIAGDARDLPISSLFDRVLVDVPCSGTGTLARNPEIKWRLEPADLVNLQQRQLAILQSAMQRVSPGGRLVYSSCSLEPEENADVIEQALAGNRNFHRSAAGEELERLRATGDLTWSEIGSLVDGDYLRTIPGIHPCDGFFAAILARAG